MLNVIAEEYKNSLYNELSKIGKCLSSEKRLEILDLLAQGPKTVESLSHETGMSFANTSRHLQVLREGRLVNNEKSKNYVIYKLASKKIIDLVYLFKDVGQDQLSEIKKIQENFDASESNIYTLSLDEAYEKLKCNEIILLDVRPEEEYNAGHIDQAKNIPMDTLENNLDHLSKDTDIIVYCRGRLCAYANLASNFLNEKGFHAYSLNQSYYEWEKYKETS